MNKQIWLFRKLGIVTLDGNATFVNVFGKKILSKLHFNLDSRTYQVLRRVYRRVGKFQRIELSYSAFGEDQVLAKYLPELDGRYLDVGAAAPKNGSNTFLLYERGWNGITIEPIESLVEKHKRIRPRDSQIHACVSNEIGTLITFFQYTADDFSTNSVERVVELEKKGITPRHTYLIPNIKLSDLDFKSNPIMPTLLNIDVEGAELDVLMSNNWEVNKPRVIAIEEWVSPIYEKTAVRLFLEQINYKLVSRCFLTSIYVHQDYLHIKQESSSSDFGWFSH